MYLTAQSLNPINLQNLFRWYDIENENSLLLLFLFPFRSIVIMCMKIQRLIRVYRIFFLLRKKISFLHDFNLFFHHLITETSLFVVWPTTPHSHWIYIQQSGGGGGDWCWFFLAFHWKQLSRNYFKIILFVCEMVCMRVCTVKYTICCLSTVLMSVFSLLNFRMNCGRAYVCMKSVSIWGTGISFCIVD